MGFTESESFDIASNEIKHEQESTSCISVSIESDNTGACAENILIYEKKELRLAILYMIVSCFFFSIMNLLIKSAGPVPVWEKSFYRNLIAFFFSGFILLKNHEKLTIPKETRFPVFMRCFLGCIGVITNFKALETMLLSDTTALTNTSPFFTIIFSSLLLKEAFPKKQIFIVIGAFIGSLLVAKPSSDIASSLPALFAVLSALTGGTAMVFLRKASLGGAKGPVIVFLFSAFSVAAMAPLTLITHEALETKQLLLLLCSGFAACGGQLYITKAYSHAPASKVSVFSYCQMIFASIWTILFFKTVPDTLSIIGYFIIIMMGILIWKINSKN